MPFTITAELLKYGQNGEKTGWTYIELPPDLIDLLKPGQRASFRVKGMLDRHPIRQTALIPVGGGILILIVNAPMRRAIGKEAGSTIQLTLEVDDEPLPPSADLLLCLDDDPIAAAFYDTLAPGHQRYYAKWIEGAKTPGTKAKRIAQAMHGFSMGMGYSEMIRYYKSRQD